MTQLILNQLFQRKAFETLFFLRCYSYLLNGHPPGLRVVCIHVPHDRMELDILLNEEMIDIVPLFSDIIENDFP